MTCWLYLHRVCLPATPVPDGGCPPNLYPSAPFDMVKFKTGHKSTMPGCPKGNGQVRHPGFLVFTSGFLVVDKHSVANGTEELLTVRIPDLVKEVRLSPLVPLNTTCLCIATAMTARYDCLWRVTH